jgi:hypothetical protein
LGEQIGKRIEEDEKVSHPDSYRQLFPLTALFRICNESTPSIVHSALHALHPRENHLQHRPYEFGFSVATNANNFSYSVAQKRY